MPTFTTEVQYVLDLMESWKTRRKGRPKSAKDRRTEKLSEADNAAIPEFGPAKLGHNDTEITGDNPLEKALRVAAPGKWYLVAFPDERKVMKRFGLDPTYRKDNDNLYVYRDTPNGDPKMGVDYTLLRIDAHYFKNGKAYIENFQARGDMRPVAEKLSQLATSAQPVRV